MSQPALYSPGERLSAQKGTHGDNNCNDAAMIACALTEQLEGAKQLVVSQAIQK